MEEFRQAAERCDIVLELDAGNRKPSEMFEDTFEMEPMEMTEDEFEANKDAMFAEQSGRLEKCSELLDGEREAGTYRDNLHLCAERVMMMRKEHAETQRATGGMFPKRASPDEPFMDSACRYFTLRGAGGQPLRINGPHNVQPLPQYQLPAGWQAYSRVRADGAPYVEFMHAEHCRQWQGYESFYPYCKASSVQSAWYKAQMYEQYKLQQARMQWQKKMQNLLQKQPVCPPSQCRVCMLQGARFCNPAQDVNPCRKDAVGRSDYTDCMAHSLLEAGAGTDANATATLAEHELMLPALATWQPSSALIQRQQGIFRTRRPWEPLVELFLGIVMGCARFVHWIATLPIRAFPSVFKAIITGFVSFKNFWLQGVGYTTDGLRVWPWCWAVQNGQGSLYNHRVCR